MSVVEETLELHKKLAVWAADPEWSLLCRYDLLREKPLRSRSDNMFRRVKNMLSGLGLASPFVSKYAWLPTLKHAQTQSEAKILLIWALGVGQEDLRIYCNGFKKRFDGISGMVPVLVTDRADFAYYSRLQWLVEYVPPLSGEGVSYSERKQKYLAWRYRDAMAVPASAGIACESEWSEVMGMRC